MLVFAFRLPPGASPVDVIFIVVAVVTAAAAREAAGGLDLLVRLAEKMLRAKPPAITFMAPLVTWLITFFAGTGHVAYAVLPVNAEVARQAGVRPERPLSIAVIASQQAITVSDFTTVRPEPPARPEPRSPNPEAAVTLLQPGTLGRQLENGELLAQGEVLSGEGCAREEKRAVIVADRLAKFETRKSLRGNEDGINRTDRVECSPMWRIDGISDAPRMVGRTAGGIAVTVRLTERAAAGTAAEPQVGAADGQPACAADLDALWLRVEHARLRLLRGFEELLCLEGLCGVEQLPHQIETVRRVLRHFRGGVLLADEVGLGKTIEAGLLLREYLLRGMIRRVLILVPAALVGQWHEELTTKFNLDFITAERGQTFADGFWRDTERVLASLALAKSPRHFEAVSASSWDLVVVDEAHHCRNRTTRNWQLVNALQRKRMVLLTATPVQNDLLELYNLLTLLEPGHLKTEADFKRNYVRRGNPRDPRNRERLRALLGEVMIRNTRSLVTIDLPPRYAQTFVLQPDERERRLYESLDAYLRRRSGNDQPAEAAEGGPEMEPPPRTDEVEGEGAPRQLELFARQTTAGVAAGARRDSRTSDSRTHELSRTRLTSLLMAAGSHPAALAGPLADLAKQDEGAVALRELTDSAVGAPGADPRLLFSIKEVKLLELLTANRQGKTLVFANFSATLDRLARVLTNAGIPFSLFTGRQTAGEKAQAVVALNTRVPVMLCSEIGGEGHNLQVANTLINFDLPWNPMRIEQRVGRIHRIGQTREVFIFNLCTAGSLEERLLRLLHDKIRMFELVVGEVGSILGNLEGGDEFESLMLNLWLASRGPAELDQAFEQLGDSLLAAQESYLQTKRLDAALFGDDYE